MTNKYFVKDLFFKVNQTYAFPNITFRFPMKAMIISVWNLVVYDHEVVYTGVPHGTTLSPFLRPSYDKDAIEISATLSYVYK